MANKINRAYWSFSEKIEIPLKEEKPVTPILHYGLGRSGSLGPSKSTSTNIVVHMILSKK
jgi:hypothetical protein